MNTKTENKGLLSYRKTTLTFVLLMYFSMCFISLPAQENAFLADQQNSSFYSSDQENFTRMKWKFKTNGMIFSSPVKYDETIYFGSNDSCLYAINADLGELVWKFPTSGIINSSPAVKDTLIYTLSMDGNVYAVGANSGQEIWHFATRGEHQRIELGLYGYPPEDEYSEDPWDFYLSSPLIIDSLLIFGSSDSSIYALHTQTGGLQWETGTGHSVHSKPAYSNEKVVVTSWNGKIIALDVYSGDKLWEFQTEISTNLLYHGLQASPTISEGIVYTTTRNEELYAIDLETGSELWSTNAGNSWLPSNLAADDDNIYFGSSVGNGRISCYNKSSHQSVYQTNTRNIVFGGPSVTENWLYEGAFNGRLYGIDKESGDVRWEFQHAHSVLGYRGFSKIDGAHDSSPYIGEFDFNSVEGQAGAVGELAKQGSVFCSPFVSDGIIYFTSTDSCLYALEGVTIDVEDVDLDTLIKGTITNFDFDFAVDEDSYDSVTVSVKSNRTSDRDAFNFQPASITTALGSAKTIAVELSTENLITSTKSIPIYLDFWQSGNRNRAIIYVSMSLLDPATAIQTDRNSKLDLSCSPNPFQNSFQLNYYLEERANILITLFDLSGNKVVEMREGLKEAGRQETRITQSLPEGLYTVVLNTESTQEIIKVMRVNN